MGRSMRGTGCGTPIASAALYLPDAPGPGVGSTSSDLGTYLLVGGQILGCELLGRTSSSILLFQNTFAAPCQKSQPGAFREVLAAALAYLQGHRSIHGISQLGVD